MRTAQFSGVVSIVDVFSSLTLFFSDTDYGDETDKFIAVIAMLCNHGLHCCGVRFVSSTPSTIER